MRILITGSNGYIGKSLSKNLIGYNITLLSRDTVDLLDSDSVNKFFSDKFFDVVIHCASVGGNRLVPDDILVYEQNVLMYQNIFNNKKCFNKLLSFGTGVEAKHQNPYSMSKGVIRDSVINTPDFYNIKIFAVFDNNELERRFIMSNIIRYMEKSDIKIHQDKYMDFFFMDDLITLINHYINNEHLPKEIDCSYKEKKTLLDVSNIINSLSDYTVPISIDNNVFGDSYIGDGLFLDGLSLNLIGLEEGIKRTYKKYK